MWDRVPPRAESFSMKKWLTWASLIDLCVALSVQESHSYTSHICIHVCDCPCRKVHLSRKSRVPPRAENFSMKKWLTWASLVDLCVALSVEVSQLHFTHLYNMTSVPLSLAHSSTPCSWTRSASSSKNTANTSRTGCFSCCYGYCIATAATFSPTCTTNCNSS